MRAEIVRLVFPVFTIGLQRRQELLAGVPLEIDVVQKELVGLVQATTQTAAWGGAVAPPVAGQPDTDVRPLEGASRFQTMLVIWAVCLFGVMPCVGYLIIPALQYFGKR